MVVRTVALPASPKPLKEREHERRGRWGSRLRGTAIVAVFAATQLTWLAGLGYVALRLFG